MNHGTVSGTDDGRFYACAACGSNNIVKSNRAIAQEYARIVRIHRRRDPIDACRDAACRNFRLPMALAPSAYRCFGKTAKGDRRHQCKGCGGTFSAGSRTRRHKRTDRTTDILLNLVNKVPLSRICEINGVTFPHVYSRIDFIYRQCLAMGAEREASLPRRLAGGSHVFATDAQTILLNWPVKGHRATVPLLHMSTVHNGTQFVVASTVDHDPDVPPGRVDEDMRRCGDFDLPRSMRRHARLWSESEYRDSVKRGLPGYLSAEDVSAGGMFALPGKGSRVRGDVFQHAHVMLVRKMIGPDLRVANFCVDRDSGLAGAFCALSHGLIREGRAHVVEVAFSKRLTNDERSGLARVGTEMFQAQCREHRADIDRAQAEYPGLSRRQALTLHKLRDRYGEVTSAERGRHLATEGISWEFHTKAEPRKSLKLKTDLGHLGWDGLAQLICAASIHPVDAWFNRARRRVTGFERGLPTASNQHRIWHAYAFYDPEMVLKMVTVLRFYHNWMLAGEKDGKTPAMRIGLAKGLVYPRDLFAF